MVTGVATERTARALEAIGQFRLPIPERSREARCVSTQEQSRSVTCTLLPVYAPERSGGGHMRLRCFFLGCAWDEGNLTEVGRVPMLCQRCARCGAQRYLSPEPEI